MSEPRLFEDILQDRNLDDVHGALIDRIGALSDSIWEILFHFEDEGESFDRQGMLQESVEQFAADMDSDIPGLMAGTILKHFETDREKGSPTVEQVAAYITQAIGTGGDTMFENMTDPEKEAFGKIWKRAEAAEPAETEVATLKTANAELQKKLDDATPPDPKKTGEDDVLKGLDPEVRKNVVAITKAADARAEKADERAEKAEGRVTKIETTLSDIKKSNRKAELRAIAKNLSHLNQSEDEITDALVAADENGTLKTIQDALEGASASASRVFDEIGTDGTGTQDGSANQKLDAIAKGIQKNKPDMKYEAAYAVACDNNPELQEEAIAEGN